MREDNGTRIIIARPKPDTYILPAISIPSNHNLHPSQTELHRVKNRKQKIQQMKLLSLDQICLRDCCQRKQEIYKQSVAQALQKKNYLIGNNKHDRYTHIDLKYPLSTKNERFRKHKKRTLTYEGETRSKNKIYFLHNLKQFELQDIEQQRYGNMNESQAKHKTGHTNKSRLIEWKDNFSKDHIHLKNYNEKPKQKQKIQKDKNADNNRKINESYIYSDLKTSRTNQRQPIKHSIQKDQAQTNQIKKYYKYLENYQSQEEQETTSPHRKVMNSEQDQQKSVQSYFKPQTRKEVNTIFHSNKLKLSSSSLKQSRIKSSRVISKAQAFKIPHTQEQQTQYLLNYKPLDPHFDVKSIVSKQNFNILLKDEKIYFGLFRDEKKHGLGILISQKQWFEGEFSYDLKIQGIQKTSQGIYVGTYAQGLRDGQGKYTWANGQEFEGEWKKGKKNGHGIWKSPKGDFYEGEWKNNKQNGKGLFTHIGGSKYSGYFKDFLKHGRGEEEFANGDKYIGQYKYGKPHGYGKYIWANGDTYEGEFAQGSREGQGTMTKKNAESYQGCFVNDLKQGQGKQRFISGEYFQGFFQKDEKIRGKFFSKKGILLQELN